MNWTEEELKEIIEKSVSSAFERQYEGRPNHCPLTDEDIFIFKRIRRFVDNASKWVGHSVILGVMAVIFYLIKTGLESYRSLGQ